MLPAQTIHELIASDFVLEPVYVEGCRRVVFNRNGDGGRINLKGNGFVSGVDGRRERGGNQEDVAVIEVGDNDVARGIDEQIIAARKIVVTCSAVQAVVAFAAEDCCGTGIPVGINVIVARTGTD